MAIEEKATQLDDLYLFEILRNPVLFSEFVNNYDKLEGEEPFELTLYQKEFALDFNSYETLCCARAVGKTLMLSNLLIWLLVFKVYPDDYICYFVPGKSQLDPVWSNLVRMFRSNTFLKQFIPTNSGINSSEFKITLSHQATLLCRIAGQSGTGANVIGLHTPYVVVDEAAYFPWQVFMEMQPILNTFTPGYKLFTSGVPSGVRDKNVLYYCDQVTSLYSKHRISAFDNPRFSEKDRLFAVEQYGGEDSDDYTHYVLGKHGKAVFALFDRANFSISDDPVYKLVLSGMLLAENLGEYMTKIDIFPGLPSKDSQAIMCIDLGYTEPSAIIILYQDRLGRLHFHGRIQLDKVSYPIQERIINMLDSKFNPAIIGIDRGAGGQGISVVQHMLEDVEYMHKDFQKRLVPVDFSTSIVVGITSEGEEIKSKTKPFATSILQDYANNHKLVFSNKDPEFISELERMTYSKTPTGEIVYKTMTPRGGKGGPDHFTAALLCGIMAYYIKNDFMLYKAERKSLAKPTWF
jgi:hypothetical protein